MDLIYQSVLPHALSSNTCCYCRLLFSQWLLNMQTHTHRLIYSLGDSDSVSMFRTKAVGRAERLVDGHRETPPPAPVVALGWGWDGHKRDGVRDPGAWRLRQRHWGDDGLVVTVTAGEEGEEGQMERKERRKWESIRVIDCDRPCRIVRGMSR